MARGIGITAAVLALCGIGYWGYMGFPMPDPPSSSPAGSPAPSAPPSGELALSTDLQRVKDRVGSAQVRHSSYRFAVHVPPTHLGDSWKAILNPAAKRLFLTPAQRPGIEWYITAVHGVTFVAHDRGDVFTHCCVQFTDHTGKRRHMITPLTPDPKLAHEISVYFENFSDTSIIADAMRTALGGS